MADETDHHEVINPITISAANSGSVITAATHPLQDVELKMDMENANEIPMADAATTTKPNTKRNWVKFDDEVNENVHNNNNGIDSVAADADGSGSDNATRATAAALTVAETTATTTAATTSANKLSPIPPPAKKQHNTTAITIASPAAAATAAAAEITAAGVTSVNSTIIARPRTPIESAQQQQQQAVVAPVQRSAISSTSLPDVAPAVLNTESTHVNLNASGRTQQQHHQQQQQQQHHQHQQQPQHHQKLKPSNVSATTASSSHSQQHNNNHTQLATSHHSSNNGTSSSTGAGSGAPSSAIHKTANVSIPIESGTPPMRTIELSTGRIREGFANGDVIVTLLPANTKWPWITPAIFRPELVPEELMAQGLTLTVEEYVNAMETLVNDYRFTVYNICYKRILVCWILFAFAVLLTLLFSGLQGVALFSLGVAWLFLNAAAIFLCMWVKLRLSRGLEKCLARVNRQLMKHKILLVLDDRGRISCHKVNLCFMYFDATQCVSFLNEFLEQTEQNGGEAIKAGWESKLDIDVNDIIIQGNNPVRLSRRQVIAQELFLSYLQRWGKDFLRRRLDWTVQEAGVHETPRHLQSSICPCQYEEEVLRNKIKIQLKGKQCCGLNCIGCWL